MIALIITFIITNTLEWFGWREQKDYSPKPVLRCIQYVVNVFYALDRAVAVILTGIPRETLSGICGRLYETGLYYRLYYLLINTWFYVGMHFKFNHCESHIGE